MEDEREEGERMVVLVVLVDHGEEEGVVAFLDQTENSIALFYFIPVLKQGFLIWTITVLYSLFLTNHRTNVRFANYSFNL